jgi:hypothetical protein
VQIRHPERTPEPTRWRGCGGGGGGEESGANPLDRQNFVAHPWRGVGLGEDGRRSPFPRGLASRLRSVADTSQSRICGAFSGHDELSMGYPVPPRPPRPFLADLRSALAKPLRESYTFFTNNTPLPTPSIPYVACTMRPTMARTQPAPAGASSDMPPSSSQARGLRMRFILPASVSAGRIPGRRRGRGVGGCESEHFNE